ncbi:MAG: ABC-ATPase domain-containing protein [Lachnospiraceae bacterium]|jgi:predicted ABC-class ATPase|nr:ABC-ATPase domain-containing protein [Lachnospiraceae bacterium]
MKQANDLKALLVSIDRKGYPAYKETRGIYQFEGYQLSIDHVQGDPFASPSNVSIYIKEKDGGFPEEYRKKKETKIALEDYILRKFAFLLEKYHFKAKGSGKSGLISTSKCGQEILERTACHIKKDTGDMIVRLEIGFPANGRTVNSRELIKIFFDFLPDCVEKSLFYKSHKEDEVREIIELAEDQQYMREQLKELGLCAFVADGSILPRESGVSSKPMRGAVPFASPQSMRVVLNLPHRGKITGMGMKKGIVLIIGGGYHGKSTLLRALELGVYNHRKGDGREYVVTDETAVKLRAEDSRSIAGVDISMFINHLPNKKNTLSFYTKDASGSTSQAANTVEAMEAGSALFLIDEDTSATNFMIRDELMQRVVKNNKEPITPFISRVGTLYEKFGISSIIVAGSSGAYFHVADQIIQLDCYEPFDVTEAAKKEAKQFPIVADLDNHCEKPEFHRCPKPNMALKKADRVKVKVMGRNSIQIDKENVELRYVEQLVDGEQLAALAYLLKYAQLKIMDGKKTLSQVVNELEMIMEKKGMEALSDASYLPMALARPRIQEVFACLNRYRGWPME